MFAPNFHITPAISTALMSIEGSRQAIMRLPINVEVLAGLRRTARLASTHYSTQIEGNRLTQEQVEEVLAGEHFPGRERDEAEVRHYYQALEQVERLGAELGPVMERDLQRVHGLVHLGRSVVSAYRDGQNVIRDATTGGIVYMPPEAGDVPGLMKELFGWINTELGAQQLPTPITAAIAHYQYATIHPYYDGNGRTARLLTTLVLHKSGYGLKGIYSLEEHYVRELRGYYSALTVGPSHNYYLGRSEADITGFIDYFTRSMATAFVAVEAHATEASASGGHDMTSLWRNLDPKQRKTLELFHDQATASAAEIASQLSLNPRTVANLCRRWVDEGFLVIGDSARRTRSYRLGGEYEQLALRR